MPTDFAPFVPPSTVEDTATPAKPSRQRRPAAVPARRRKPRPPAAGEPKIPPAPRHERPMRKKRTKLPPARKATALVVPMKPMPKAKKERKKRELKMPFSDAMAISALLKPADFKMFESLTETLQNVNKATRRRVLGAIEKVFG